MVPPKWSRDQRSRKHERPGRSGSARQGDPSSSESTTRRSLGRNERSGWKRTGHCERSRFHGQPGGGDGSSGQGQSNGEVRHHQRPSLVRNARRHERSGRKMDRFWKWSRLHDRTGAPGRLPPATARRRVASPQAARRLRLPIRAIRRRRKSTSPINRLRARRSKTKLVPRRRLALWAAGFLCFLQTTVASTFFLRERSELKGPLRRARRVKAGSKGGPGVLCRPRSLSPSLNQPRRARQAVVPKIRFSGRPSHSSKLP